jgi:hypothetical protein
LALTTLRAVDLYLWRLSSLVLSCSILLLGTNSIGGMFCALPGALPVTLAAGLAAALAVCWHWG